jgi:hypothetical protein
MITVRIKPKIRHERMAVTRERTELMNPWNPIGRKIAWKAVVAGAEITRRGQARKQHRHGNESGQKAQHRMGSFVESEPGSTASLRNSLLRRKRQAQALRDRPACVIFARNEGDRVNTFAGVDHGRRPELGSKLFRPNASAQSLGALQRSQFAWTDRASGLHNQNNLSWRSLKLTLPNGMRWLRHLWFLNSGTRSERT